jgi:hypothetical protein
MTIIFGSVAKVIARLLRLETTKLRPQIVETPRGGDRACQYLEYRRSS